MTTAAMATYAYDQIDQARTELNAVSKWSPYATDARTCSDKNGVVTVVALPGIDAVLGVKNARTTQIPFEMG
jgi:hypothetical protein